MSDIQLATQCVENTFEVFQLDYYWFKEGTEFCLKFGNLEVCEVKPTLHASVEGKTHMMWGSNSGKLA